MVEATWDRAWKALLDAAFERYNIVSEGDLREAVRRLEATAGTELSGRSG